MSNPSRSTRPDRQHGDVAIERLVRLSGECPPVPDAAARRVRSRVHGIWRAGVRRRRRRRRLAVAVALVLAAGLAGWRWQPWSHEQSVGAVQVARGALRLDGSELVAGDVITVGSLRTGVERAALELAGGASVRLGRSTHLDLLADREMRLVAGSVYLDVSPGDEALEVHTPFGTVRDLGTQFELRVEPDHLRIRVREGLVEMQAPGGKLSAAEGVELRVGRRGLASRRPVATHGQPWRAYLEVAPPFALEGATLDAYLRWLHRETGWQLRWRDPVLAATAKQVVLHGSLEGVPVEQSPTLVLPTCGLTAILRDGVLEISRASLRDPDDPLAEES